MVSITVITYLSLFVSSFLAASILPMSPDALAAYMAANGYALFFIIAVATLGTYAGSCTTYYLGYLSREKILKKWMKGEEKKLKKYHIIFEKYGEPIILFSWIPIVGDLFVVIAGILEINFWNVTFYLFLGAIVRFAFMAYVVGGLI